MEAQQVWHLSFVSTWIFVFFFLSVCSGMSTLNLESTVFVALAGEEIDIKCKLVIPANQTRDVLTCSDPFKNQIYSYDISEMTGQTKTVQLKLKNLTMSGEYSCQYKKATVYWFLRVRGEGYRDLVMWDYTEFIIVAVFTGVLLVFSVVGSVCVFRGHGKKCTTERGNTDRKRKQNTEEMKETEMEEDNMDVITDPSTSFYASLEPRPMSIYDVLDHSAANREPDQSKAKPKKRKPKETASVNFWCFVTFCYHGKQ
ncbi:hypothetical protein EPR50_G00016310 [Perca flavescens]|uniref:Uncharacterized protein n=1 Tax=Perca flavescens TaxID=8167 RepID=A0A484DLE6_PERFV|nr:hypothetical protein EPR50_G00016310 [Perca flavescens]